MTVRLTGGDRGAAVSKKGGTYGGRREPVSGILEEKGKITAKTCQKPWVTETAQEGNYYHKKTKGGE